jgi:hypothetical protein
MSQGMSQDTNGKPVKLTEAQADALSMMREYDAWLEPYKMGSGYFFASEKRGHIQPVKGGTVKALLTRGFIAQHKDAPWRTIKNLYLTRAGREALEAYERTLAGQS